jgi:hypothetical protein
MPATWNQLDIPLPKGWPRCVRRAVVYLISMAQASLTITGSWAANSYNARIRLKAENDPSRVLRRFILAIAGRAIVRWTTARPDSADQNGSSRKN